MPYVSRAGEKLAHALAEFKIDVRNLVAADFGCSTGGFTDCLLQNGVAKVFAVDTGYGVIEWVLRNDARVVVMERQNAMHIVLPELVDFISMDTSWTKVKNVLPNAFKNLKPNGTIIILVKPHYEAEARERQKGVVPDEMLPDILMRVRSDIEALGGTTIAETESPITGGKGGNREFLWLIKRT